MRIAASYLRLRASIAERYRAEPLDDLLESLDGPVRARRADVRAAARGIQLGERLARLLRLRPDTCLYRALTRYAVLRRVGLCPHFVMGIDDEDPDVGHAWIELDGAPFLEPPPSPRLRRTFDHRARA